MVVQILFIIVQAVSNRMKQITVIVDLDYYSAFRLPQPGDVGASRLLWLHSEIYRKPQEARYPQCRT